MHRRSNQPRNMIAKFAGKCACCGADIKAGEYITYYRSRREIAHVGGLEGNSSTCTANIRNQPGYVDLDRMYEDQCADICGRS